MQTCTLHGEQEEPPARPIRIETREQVTGAQSQLDNEKSNGGNKCGHKFHTAVAILLSYKIAKSMKKKRSKMHVLRHQALAAFCRYRPNPVSDGIKNTHILTRYMACKSARVD